MEGVFRRFVLGEESKTKDHISPILRGKGSRKRKIFNVLRIPFPCSSISTCIVGVTLNKSKVVSQELSEL